MFLQKSIFNYTKSITLIFCIVMLVSCASKQIVTNQTIKEEKPKLIFLSYNIIKNDNAVNSITLINQKIIDGKLKGSTKTNDKSNIGDLKCTSFDKDFNEIEKHSIKNPLVKIVEFINDLGNFEKRIIELDSAQFTLRLQLHPKVKYISISELTHSGIKKHLSTEIE